MGSECRFLVAGNLAVDVRFEGFSKFPAPEQSVRVPGAAIGVGGCAANTARALGRLGLTASTAGRIGKDEAGRIILDELKRDNVNSVARIDPDNPTAIAGVLLHDGGRKRSFISSPGANRLFNNEDIPDSALDNCDWLHIGGFYTTDKLALGIGKLMERASKRQLPVSCGLSWNSRGTWKLIEPAYPTLKILFLNRQEAAYLGFDKDPRIACRQLVEAGPEVVILTDGENGTFAATASVDVFSPTITTQVVDTTGAGDCFCAGCLAWIGRNGFNTDEPSIASMVKWGNIAGSLSVGGAGTLGKLNASAFAATIL